MFEAHNFGSEPDWQESFAQVWHGIRKEVKQHQDEHSLFMSCSLDAKGVRVIRTALTVWSR